jgi:acylpyruvate hydrolase
MRLTTVRTSTGDDSGTRAGRIEDDRVVLLAWNDLSQLLSQPGWQDLARADGESVPLADVELATLLPTPDKIICVGLNYASHIAEMGRQQPDHPTLFAKYRGALIGPTDPVQLPAVSSAMDWEVELGVVIGRAARNVDEADALDHIAGYCVVNDVTARDWQRRTTQFLAGKTFEATTPVGPVLVTPDELFRPDGLGLRVQCEVDGELMQDGNTSDLCFSPAAIVAYVSQIITLQPGDLIATGTPAGVGDGRNPPVYLRPGSIMRTTVEGIGELVNRCEQSTAPPRTQ